LPGKIPKRVRYLQGLSSSNYQRERAAANSATDVEHKLLVTEEVRDLREFSQDSSEAPVPLVPDKYSELPEISGGPIGEVALFDSHACCYSPTKLCLVYKPNVDVQEALFEFVLDPLDNFSPQAAVLVARNEFGRDQRP
jgi:hypothetical protein